MTLPGSAGQGVSGSVTYSGKTVLVTGSTDGLGEATARALASRGAHVIVHGRNAERGVRLADEIMNAGEGSASFHRADFASLTEVREFAETIASQHPKLDLLVNNAGIAFPADQPRRTSADGYELQFAVNYLAGWVLVNTLRPNLAAAAPSRIINVSSIAASPIDFDDVMLEKAGANARGYAQSKLAQVSMTFALAPSFANDGITMIAMHPATFMDTTMVSDLGVAPTSSVEEGRDHLMSLITAPALEPGAFYVEEKPANPNDPQANDPRARERLMALSAQLTGVEAK